MPQETTKDSPLLLNFTYNLGFFIICVLSYGFQRHQKISFYYNFILKEKAEWSFNVIDNMNNGYLSLKK